MKAAGLSAALVLALPVPARGHEAGISYGDLEVGGEQVTVSLRISAAELAAAWPRPGGDDASLGAGTGGDLPPHRAREILDLLSMTRGGSPCALEPGAGRIDPPDGLRVTGVFRCERPGEPIDVHVGLLGRMPRGHVHLAKVLAGRGVEQHVLRGGHDTFLVHTPAPGWIQAARFLRLGVEHIFTGYDHVAFLLGLLLLRCTLKNLARVVTSFTAAHSITLALASLQIVSPPARLVESLIAVSIVWVAVENLLELRHPAPRREAQRWRLGFAFGLVHGFGFAGALQELDLPRSSLAAALFSFNLGVELGQAAIVALALPLLALLRRRPGFAPSGPRLGSITIGVAGLVWLAERLLLAR